MSDVIAFLNARLDDDEAVALTSQAVNYQSNSGVWTFSDGEAEAEWESQRRFGGRCKVVVHSSVRGGNFALDSSGNPRTQNPDMIHIARYDPARALRDVAAKRGVIREMEAARTSLEERGINVPFFITWTLWHLAAVYSDHPDYQKEWAI
ncbi:DUF6221 family protein [Rhodococcus globerulus]|uniref:DUF6221 family protein n=1 Tax=Rhodococcus globerulus TaxID=33008 RepID=UPI0039E87A2E